MTGVIRNKFTCPGNNQTWVVGVVRGLCSMQSIRNPGKWVWFLESSLRKRRHLANCSQKTGWKRVKAHLVLNHLDPEEPGITYVCIFFMKTTRMAILRYQGNLKVQSLAGQPLSNYNSYPERRVQIFNHFCHSPLSEWKWKSLSRAQLFVTPWDYTVRGILQARIP